MGHRSTFVGLDVHRDSIDVALAEGGRTGEVRHYGAIPSDRTALEKLRRRLQTPGRRLHFVYEAGPCGFAIYRQLTEAGEECAVVSPSQIPRRSGDRVKTDRRDATTLARLHRAGELSAIHVPHPDDEALRDLVRAREAAVGVGTQAKHRLKAFLLRHGRHYTGRPGWTRAYRRWIAALSFPSVPQQVALQEYRDAIDEAERRVDRLTQQVQDLVPQWRWAPLVDALQALRGVSFVTAAGLAAEIGDLRRFDRPRTLMAYLGLVPSEHSSGATVRRGTLTKTGNAHARRLLGEAAWAYQARPRVGRELLARQERVSAPVRAIAWKAQLRLTGRFRRLIARGKPKPKVATAVARELTGFVWAIGQEVSPTTD
jgi:transposase